MTSGTYLQPPARAATLAERLATSQERPPEAPFTCLQQEPRTSGPRLARGVWVVATVVVALELAVSARYGFHRDELYFIAAGRHLAFGYVDMPPLAPLLTRLGVAAFGLSPTAVRVFPALAAAGVVVAGGATAKLLGGRSAAQVLAALASGCAPVVLAAAHLGGTTAYDLLFSAVAVAAAVAAIEHERHRAWLVAGVAVGLGLENKDLPLLLVAVLGVGILACGPRQVLRDRWLWLGCAIALALWVPNLAWQAAHGWPQLAMASALRTEHSAASDYTTVLPAQVLYMGVVTLPLAILGWRRLWKGAGTRFLALAALALLAYVALYIPGRAYYTAGLLPALFAAGAVALEARHGYRLPKRWPLAPVVGGLVSLPLTLPVLPMSAWAGNAAVHKVNYDMTETIGWPQFVAKIDTVVHGLPTAERGQSAIFTANYGEASALAVLGSADKLPPVLSGHNTYWLWGPGRAPDATVVTVGAAGQLRPYFAACHDVTAFRSPDGVVNDENNVPVSVCTGPRGPWRMFWAKLRHYD